MSRIAIRPLGPLAQAVDKVMWPLMAILMELNGTPGESPMLTHRWNNVKFRQDQAKCLQIHLMTKEVNDPLAQARNGLTRHLPIIGWQKYAVVEPVHHPEIEWHIGWFSKYLIGASRIKLRGPVKVLLGPDPVNFFGSDLSGKQISVRLVGYGRLGYGDQYAHLPLL